MVRKVEALRQRILALHRRLERLELLLRAKSMVKSIMKQHFDDNVRKALVLARSFLDKYRDLHEVICIADVEDDKEEMFMSYIQNIDQYFEKLMEALEDHLQFLESKTNLKRSRGTGVLEVIDHLHQATFRFLKNINRNPHVESQSQTGEAESASESKYVFEGEDLGDLERISGGAFTSKYSSDGVFKGVVVGDFEDTILESLRAAYGSGKKGGCKGASKNER